MAQSEISGRTKHLGLIADPAAQARSPSMANALFPGVRVEAGAALAMGRAIHGGVPMLAAQMDLMLQFMGVE